jgi:single-strand DNA-binding protein
MSSNGLMVTVVGWAASTPREVVGDGVPFTSFRVATTPRYFDNRQGVWADGRTEWISVKAFRDVAFNVAASIRKGDPVLVQGRLRTEEWVSEAGPRTGLVLDAHALGHDLSRGRGSFARSVHVTGTPTEEDGSGGGGGTAVEEIEDPWATDGAVDETAAASATGDEATGGRKAAGEKLAQVTP